MTPMEAIEKKASLPKRIMRGIWSFFTGIPGAVYGLFLLVILGIKRSLLEARYWFSLFLYTSKNFLRLEALLSAAGAVFFFGYVINYDLAQSGEQLIYYSYIYFSVVMVLLAMNTLPREKEAGTLEILWSQPLSRRSLIVVQLVTLSVWMFVLNLVWLLFIQYFTAYPEGKWVLLLLVWTTTVSVGAMTLLISTFCRHAIATGLVALLILGLHFFWLTSIGPVQLFFVPDNLEQLIAPPEPAQPSFGGGGFGGGDFGGRGGRGGRGGGFGYQSTSLYAVWFNLMFNRLTLIVTTGFILDFLFRRLRRTSQWFT